MSEARKILLVDDDKEFVEANKALLEAEGYEVFTAHDGAGGLSMARETRPDLLILDVMMTTKTEGFDISRKIHDVPELKDLPVILLTGIRKEMHVTYPIEPDETWLPVDSLFEKPIEPAVLLEEIKKRIG